MFQTNGQAPLLGAATPDKPFGFHDATVGGGWQVPGEPYTQASSKSENEFQWYRARMLGGALDGPQLAAVAAVLAGAWLLWERAAKPLARIESESEVLHG